MPRRRNEAGAVEGIPPDLDPRIVLEQYLTEKTTSQIAKQYGLRRKTLVGWLRQVCPEEWKQVQIVRAEIRKDDGNEGLETAPDALSLARAREMIRSAQWDLERLDRATYGIDQPAQGGHIVINIGVRARDPHTVDQNTVIDKQQVVVSAGLSESD